MPDFNNKLRGLLENPAFNLGIGLLSAGGASPIPMSSGQRIAQGVQFAQGAQQQGLSNELLRQRIADEAGQSDARAQLSGLLPELFPGREGHLMGLLGQIDPLSTVQSLLNPQQERALPADVRAAQWLSDPSTDPNARAAYLEERERGAASEELSLMIEQAKYAQLQRQADEDERIRRRDQVIVSNSIDGSFEELEKLVKANNVLRDTVFRPGNPFNVAAGAVAAGTRAAMESIGLEGPDVDAALTAISDIKKSSSRLQGNLANAANSSSNQRLDLIRNSVPTLDSDTNAIPGLSASSGRDLLRLADAEQVAPSRLEDLQRFVFTLEATPELISTMQLEDLGQLNPSLMSDELADIANQRFEALQ
jgi:hypothetical protein